LAQVRYDACAGTPLELYVDATARILLSMLVAFACAASAHAQTRNRLSIVIDSGVGMLQTPARVAFRESCHDAGFNPCTATGNPSPAQETCNACVRDTISATPACASNWLSTCRTAYAACVATVTGQSCDAIMSATTAIATRGDGSVELPGCDLDSNASADDSKLFQAKVAVQSTAAAVTDIEVALWRFAQVTGGQTCMSAAECPNVPGGAFSCENFSGANRCVFDADVLDAATTPGFEGQCSPFTHTGSPSTFTCNACDITTSYDRVRCELLDLNQVRSGGRSPLGGGTATVQCYPAADPTHRFITYHGVGCGMAGGDRLVDFPPDPMSSNLAAIGAWLDHAQPAPATDVELRANGASPVAALLRDVRTTLLDTLAADASATCRRYAIALVLDGPDNCEPNSASVDAAVALQSLSFTPPGGQPVTGRAVPVHVFGFGECAIGEPNCADLLPLDAVAAAGGTGSAVRVATEAELATALGTLAMSLEVDTCVDALFADSFE
jgi:hypothetical protein